MVGNGMAAVSNGVSVGVGVAVAVAVAVVWLMVLRAGILWLDMICCCVCDFGLCLLMSCLY